MTKRSKAYSRLRRYAVPVLCISVCGLIIWWITTCRPDPPPPPPQPVTNTLPGKPQKSEHERELLAIKHDQRFLKEIDFDVEAEVSVEIRKAFKREVLTKEAVNNFVDTESGPWDATIKYINREERTRRFLERYVLTDVDLRLYIAEFYFRCNELQLDRLADKIEKLQSSTMRSDLAKELTAFPNSMSFDREQILIPRHAGLAMRTVAKKVQQAVVNKWYPFGGNKAYSEKRVKSTLLKLLRERLRLIYQTNRTLPSSIQKVNSSYTKGNKIPSHAESHDLLLNEICRLRAKMETRIVAVQATRELARTNMTYDRVEDWVSPFYGLIDQATKVWRIVTQGNDSRTVAEKFNEKVISEKELRNFFGDISRRNQEVLDGTLAGFRINCETPEMKKTGFPPVDVIGTGPNPPPIHVGTLTAMDVADLLDISAGGLTVWLWGTAATDPTMTLAIVAAVVQGIISSVQYIKEDELIRGVRDELLKFPWNALYGGSERRSIFDAVDKRIDDVFNKQKAQIRSVQK